MSQYIDFLAEKLEEGEGMLIEIRPISEITSQELFSMSSILKMQTGGWFVLLNGVVHSRWETHEEAFLDATDLASWFS